MSGWESANAMTCKNTSSSISAAVHLRWHADYVCKVGNRKQNKLLANADLGITGVFDPCVYTVIWNPSELVDDSRAQKLCDVLKSGINRDGEMMCDSVTLLRVYRK